MPIAFIRVVDACSYPLDRGVPPLTDDIGRPEPASQGNAVGVTAEHDGLLRTETTGGNHTTETHRAITDYGGDLARAHIRPERRVMARAHHVGEGEPWWQGGRSGLGRRRTRRPPRGVPDTGTA